MPLYPITPRGDERIDIHTANANRDGSTGIYSDSAEAGVALGTEVHRLRIVAVGNTVQGAVRVYKKSGGSRTLLPGMEFMVPARTVAASLPPWSLSLNLQKGDGCGVILLRSGQTISFSTEAGDQFYASWDGWDMG